MTSETSGTPYTSYVVTGDAVILWHGDATSEQDARDQAARSAGYESEAQMVRTLEQPSDLVAESMCRYVVEAVADPDCGSTTGELIDHTNDLTRAYEIADACDGEPFGRAIIDTDTGLVDYGHGFGVPIPDLED